jgi:hypothetical protein
MFEMPHGGLAGLIAIAVTALVAFTLGQFWFFGFAFLAHWQLSLIGWLRGFLLLSMVWGTGLQWMIWTGAKPGGRAWAPVPSGAVPWMGALLAVLLFVWWSASERYDCVLMAHPFAGLIVFGVILFGEAAIIRRLRDTGRDPAAFVALLALEAVMLFSNGEGMAVDHFRKGLEHFDRDHARTFWITSSGETKFVMNFERKEFVLSARTGDQPFELSRPFPSRICR